MRKSMVLLFVVAAIGLGFAGCAPPTAVKHVPDIVWPPAPEKPRVKLVAYYDSRSDVEKSSSMMRFLGEEPVLYLNRPHGVAADREGNIFVSDIGYEVFKVFEFDFSHGQFREIGSSAANKIKTPLGLAVDNDRKLLFVADSGDKDVKVFDQDSGSLKFVIGQEPGTFGRPAAVAVNPRTQRVYVADPKAQVVKAFDYEGHYLFSIGKGVRSSSDEGFNVPAALALDKAGNLYVADMFNRYIKVFTSEGKFIKKIGRGVGTGFGYFSKVVGVALDSEDHIYALDIDLGNIQIFDQDNNLLLVVGRSGRDLGRFLLPTSIFIDGNDRIYVTDTFNHRVQVFQYMGKEKTDGQQAGNEAESVSK